MRLLIFGPDGKLLRELPDVVRTNVTRPGALVCHLAPGSPLQRWVAAPGMWHHVEEWRDIEPAIGVAPPVIPGVQDPFLPPTPFTGSMTEQMKIICNCTDRRCPVTLTPPDSGTRAWWRAILTRTTTDALGPGASPLRQCSRERGHDGDHTWPDRDWTWPYGIHNHHPDCPRFPRPATTVQEGQPAQPPAGLTSTDDTAPDEQPGAFPDDEQPSALARLAEPAREYPLIAAPDRVARPFVAALDTLPALPPARTRTHGAGRYVWGACAALEAASDTVWCELAPDHQGQHRTTQGGQRHTW